mgnify:CR=1 FL=1
MNLIKVFQFLWIFPELAQSITFYVLNSDLDGKVEGCDECARIGKKGKL